MSIIKVPEPPKFPRKRYDVTVREVDKPGDSVVSVKATYTSEGNPLLKYSFTSGNVEEAFCINRDGLITIARPLDREKVSQYTLGVMVQKGKWNDTTVVVVNIQDINDGAPLFTKAVYEKEVKENTGKYLIR